MHPCDARQIPAQLRHGEPVTEGQRSGAAAAAPPASRRIIGTSTSDPSPPSERRGRRKALVVQRSRQALPGKIAAWQVVKGV